jgi:hypothetical protein
MAFSIPVINLSPWFGGSDADRRAVAREFDRAYREVGFLQVTGHRVPESIVSGAFDAMNAYFTLPEDEKRRAVPANKELISGYTARLSESFSYSMSIESPPDLMEGFMVNADDVGRDPNTNPYSRNVWPENPAWFRDRVWDYFTTVRGLSFALCRVAAVALEVDPGFFDGVWRDVAPESGAFIVNAGDALAVWTNDAWRSTVHRVLPSKTPGGSVRRSIALFQDGNVDSVMECLPTCQSADNPPKYAPITLGQHVLDKLDAGRQLVRTDAQQTIGDRLSS